MGISKNEAIMTAGALMMIAPVLVFLIRWAPCLSQQCGMDWTISFVGALVFLFGAYLVFVHSKESEAYDTTG